jgi:hypothetical protein
MVPCRCDLISCNLTTPNRADPKRRAGQPTFEIMMMMNRLKRDHTVLQPRPEILWLYLVS